MIWLKLRLEYPIKVMLLAYQPKIISVFMDLLYIYINVRIIPSCQDSSSQNQTSIEKNWI